MPTLLINHGERGQDGQPLVLPRLAEPGVDRSGQLAGAVGCGLAIAVWAGSWVAAKVALPVYSPLDLALLRMGLPAVLLLAALPFSRSTRRFDFRHDGPWILVAGVAMGIQQYVWGEGLMLTTVSNGALIQAVGPIVTVLMVAGLGHERVRLRQVLGLIAGFAGVAVIVGWRSSGPEGGDLAGDLLIGAGSCLWGVATVAAAPLLRRYSAVQEMGYSFAVATLVLLPLAIIRGAATWQVAPTPLALIGVAYLVLGATLIGYLIWHASVKQIGANRAMVFFYSQPLVAIALAAVLLGETIQPAHVVGAVVVFAGIALVQKK